MYQQIYQYLYFGYTFDREIPDWLYKSLEDKTAQFEYTPEEAGALLDKIFEELVGNRDKDGECIIPISGGWDSRILLGMAMNHIDHNKIKTFSFGSPGQLDYDIGALVADRLNLKHVAVDLSKIEIEWNDLLNTAEESPWTYMPDPYFNRVSIAKIANAGDYLLSGFMGDPLTGGHIYENNSNEKAIKNFVREQCFTKKNVLTPDEYNPKKDIPQLSSNKIMGAGELLDFGIRQVNCVAPIVTPQKKWDSWGGNLGKFKRLNTHVVAPFIHPDWANYWLNAPLSAKEDQKLYLEMMKVKFPELADLPSTYSLGASPNSHWKYAFKKIKRNIHKRINNKLPFLNMRYTAELNYLDFARAFRERKDYKGVLNIAFEYLEKNDLVPWINLEKLKNEHMDCEHNHEREMLVLIGLALNMCNNVLMES